MDLYQTDPEFEERFEAFALEEVAQEAGRQLGETTRWTATLAALLGCQGVEAFRAALPRALDAGVSAVAVRRASTRRWTIWALAGCCRF